MYSLCTKTRLGRHIFGASWEMLWKFKEILQGKKKFRFECGSTSKEQIMNNEKIPHANWKSIERKSETFIPMA